jgi:hypothetical protein
VRRALAWVALPPLLALSGCPTPEPVDDDTTAADDDDTTDDPGTLQVPTSLPAADIHELYEQTLIPPDFHKPPLTWTQTGGALPAGLALQANGDVEGVASELGSFTFQARVVDDEGRVGEGSVGLEVVLDEASLFTGVWVEQPQGICVDLGLLCAPFARLVDAGEPWHSWELVPARFHVGPDAQPDAGFDDDVLWDLLDPTEVQWSWVPLEDLAEDGSTLYPEDASIDPAGVLQAGELTGRGRIEITPSEQPAGTAIGFIVPPDWCPDPGC